MSKKIVQVEVSEKAHELFEALNEITKTTKVALKDGWQPGQDIPVILLSSVAKFAAIVGGIQAAGDEIKEDLGAFIAAAGLGAKDVVATVLKKD